MDLLSNITDPVERVIAEMALAGHNVVYRDGEWKHGLQRSGGVQGFGERRMAEADQVALNQRLQEVQQAQQPAPPVVAQQQSSYQQAVGTIGGQFGGAYRQASDGSWRGSRGGFISAWERQELGGRVAADMHYREQAALRSQQESLLEQPTGALADLDMGGGSVPGDTGWAAGGARGRAAGGRGGGLGGLFFGGAALGGLLGAGSNLMEQGGALAQRGAQQVGAFFENVFTLAGSGLGQTGVGAARIASSLVGLLVNGFTMTAGLGVTLAAGLVGIAAMGLTAVSSMVGITIGGAIGGILAAGVMLAGTAVSEAVGKIFGAIGEAAQAGLQGVVTVVRDLGTVSRDLSQATLSMRGAGGLSGGASMQALLMGTGLGQSSAQTAGMFGYGMNPMFAGARFGAFGANYNAEDPAGSMYGAARMVSGLPSFLQMPVANAMTGGQGEALLKMAQVPWDELAQTITLAQRLSTGRNADDMSRLEMARGRVGMLAETVKIDVLEALLPLMYRALQGIVGFYDAHKEQIAAFVSNLPNLILHGLTMLGQGLLSLIDWARLAYMAAKEGWNWLKENWADFKANAGFGNGAGAGTIGHGGGSPGGGAGQTIGAARRGWTGQDRAPGDNWWEYEAARHPWAAGAAGAGLLLGGRELLGSGVRAAGRAAWGGIRGFFGRGAATAAAEAGAAGAEAWTGAGAAGASGAGVLGPAAAILGTAAGGWFLGDWIARTFNIGGRGDQVRANRYSQQVEARFGGIGDEAPGFTQRWAHLRSQQSDPVLRLMDDAHKGLENVLKELPNWFKEAQRQQQQPELKISGQINIAPEMTAKMLYQLNGQMWREFQAGVS